MGVKQLPRRSSALPKAAYGGDLGFREVVKS